MKFLRIFKRFDIRISIELWLLFTVIYYGAYIYLVKYSSDYCKIADSYCIEFLPYGDFLACYIAIVGLYFVVSSLDDWKHQDKYQTAKINLIKLHEIESILSKFQRALSNFNHYYLDYKPNNLLDNEITETNSFKKYKAIKRDLKIQHQLKEYKLDISTKSINLFQNDFEYCISLAEKYVQEIDKEVININNEKIVHINNRVTKEKEDNKIKEEEIDNISNNDDKIFARIRLKAKRISALEDNILSSDLVNLDIKTEDLKTILEAKNNDFNKFSEMLKKIQKNVNDHLG